MAFHASPSVSSHSHPEERHQEAGGPLPLPRGAATARRRADARPRPSPPRSRPSLTILREKDGVRRLRSGLLTRRVCGARLFLRRSVFSSVTGACSSVEDRSGSNPVTGGSPSMCVVTRCANHNPRGRGFCRFVVRAVQVPAHPVGELDTFDLVVGQHLSIDLLRGRGRREPSRTRPDGGRANPVPMLVARDLDVTVDERVVPDLQATVVRVHGRRESIESGRPATGTSQRSLDEVAAVEQRHERNERGKA